MASQEQPFEFPAGGPLENEWKKLQGNDEKKEKKPRDTSNLPPTPDLSRHFPKPEKEEEPEEPQQNLFD